MTTSNCSNKGLLSEFLKNRKLGEISIINSTGKSLPIEFLSYYGFYEHVIFQNDMSDESYITAVIALEKYHLLSRNSTRMQTLFDLPFAFIGFNSSEATTHSNLIFFAFLKHYKQYGKGWATDVVEHTKFCDILWLSYIMLYYPDIIVSKLKYLKPSQNIHLDKKTLKSMKKWTVKDTFKTGFDLFFDISYSSWQNLVSSTATNDSYMNRIGTIFIALGLIESKIKGDTELTYRYLIQGANLEQDLYRGVIALIKVSSHCYSDGRYYIGLKILRCCYTICNGYFCNSFVNKLYCDRKAKFETE
eukprot:28006_1